MSDQVTHHKDLAYFMVCFFSPRGGKTQALQGTTQPCLLGSLTTSMMSYSTQFLLAHSVLVTWALLCSSKGSNVCQPRDFHMFYVCCLDYTELFSVSLRQKGLLRQSVRNGTPYYTASLACFLSYHY